MTCLSKFVPTSTLADISIVVCAEMKVTYDKVCGKGRVHPLPDARGAIVWLARMFTNFSYLEIAYFIGGRNHSTATTAFIRATSRQTDDQKFRSQIVRMEGVIGSLALPIDNGFRGVSGNCAGEFIASIKDAHAA